MDTKAESERLSGLLERAKVVPNPNTWFVPIHDTRRILDKDALRELFNTRPRDPVSEDRMREAIERVQQEFLLALATLMYCSESAIPKLEQACDQLLQGQEPGIPTDDQLPLGEADARSHFGRHGLECQNYFCAIILREDDDRDVSDRAVRLPFVQVPEMIPGGEGASGDVYKVVVARGHWKGDSWSTNDEERVLARKVFHNKGQSNAEKFERELANLKELGKARTVHKNVMFRLGSLKTQDEFSIFYPLAKCDLGMYLQNYRYSNRAPSGDTGKTINLLRNATDLVDGLQWLHNPRPGHCIYHFDIKPNNILVVEDKGKETWKLHDFDLAHPKERSASSTGKDESSSEFSSDLINQEPRTFRAPEVVNHGRAGHKSDVWSITCILVLVFCFADDGTRGVNAFTESRERHLSPDKGDRVVDYFYDDVERPGDYKGLHASVIKQLELLKRNASGRTFAEFTYVDTILDYFLQNIFVRKEDRHNSEKLLRTMSCLLDDFTYSWHSWQQSLKRIDSVAPSEDLKSPRAPPANDTHEQPRAEHDSSPVSFSRRSRDSSSFLASGPQIGTHQGQSSAQVGSTNSSYHASSSESPRFSLSGTVLTRSPSPKSAPREEVDDIHPTDCPSIDRTDSSSSCTTLCKTIKGLKGGKTPPDMRCSDFERLLHGPKRRELNAKCPNCDKAPIISVTRLRSEPILETLLRTSGDPKIDLEVLSPSRNTPLIECYERNFPDGAIALLKAGARFSEEDYKYHLSEMTPDFKRKFRPLNKSWRKKHGLLHILGN